MVYSSINSTGALPVVDQTQRTEQQQQQTAQSQQQANVYTGAQQALQNQALAQGSQIMQGNINPSFGLPQSVWDAAMFNFNKYNAPLLAAQHGAGSPAINSAMQELNLNLAAQSGQNAVSNSLNALDTAAKYAFTPVGSNAMNTGTQQQQGSSNQTSWGIDTGATMQALYDLLGLGGGGSSSTFPNSTTSANGTIYSTGSP